MHVYMEIFIKHVWINKTKDTIPTYEEIIANIIHIINLQYINEVEGKSFSKI